MARTNVKIVGNNPKEKLESLLNQCSNNNQISLFLNRNNDILNYLKELTGIDRSAMIVLYHYKEQITEIPKCICGKERSYHCYGYRPTCGNKKCINTIRENSKKETCIEKYGVECVTQLDSMKEKSKKTLLEKYGVDNSTKCPEIIKKRQENNLKKYGIIEPISLKEVRGKTISDAERGIIKIQNELPEGYNILESDKISVYKLICHKNHIFNISKYTLRNKKKNSVELCNLCNEDIGSSIEQDIFEYISSIYGGVISRSNRKLISPFEIDMVLEEKKLCIEVNGDYWHSIKVNDDMYYHLNKLNMCLSKGYNLIQIKEYDWNNKREIIKSKLFNLINDILDLNDFNINNDEFILDLSWYDNRICSGFYEIETLLPEIINVGKELQWNCGYKKYKKYRCVPCEEK
jgi:hypothetical protein